jgi:hypothetical protein
VSVILFIICWSTKKRNEDKNLHNLIFFHCRKINYSQKRKKKMKFRRFCAFFLRKILSLCRVGHQNCLLSYYCSCYCCPTRHKQKKKNVQDKWKWLWNADNCILNLKITVSLDSFFTIFCCCCFHSFLVHFSCHNWFISFWVKIIH